MRVRQNTVRLRDNRRREVRFSSSGRVKERGVMKRGWRAAIERRRRHLQRKRLRAWRGFSCVLLLRPGADASPRHAGREFGPGLCIIYERRHILRLNICWFVKSTNMRSCPSPWHISSADGKHCRTFNWWEQRLVTRTPRSPPSLVPSPLLWRRTGKKGRGRRGCLYERGRRWAKAGLKVTDSHCERTASRKAPRTYLCSLVFMFSFTLKCQQQTPRQRWIGKQAEGGKTTLFVKTVPLC